MRSRSSLGFLVGGTVSLAAALLHVGIIFVGAPAYRFFGAGDEMAELAAAGSVLPAWVTTAVAIVLALWSAWAFSGLGFIRRLPFLRTGLALITAAFTLRGLGVVPEVYWLIQAPGAVPAQEIVFSLVSLLAGVSYGIGTIGAWPGLSERGQTAARGEVSS